MNFMVNPLLTLVGAGPGDPELITVKAMRAIGQAKVILYDALANKALLEYAAPDGQMLHELFPRLGFTAVARHKQRKITLYRQGDCNFLVNEEPNSFAADFAAKHDPDKVVEIVRKLPDQVGFAVLPRRWVVERFFAWLSRNRRLAKDFEGTIASATAFLYAASVMLLARRLARSV